VAGDMLKVKITKPTDENPLFDEKSQIK